MRRRSTSVAALLALALATAAGAGCGGSGGGSGGHYSAAQIKAAYFKGAGDPTVRGSWVDADYHSHTNYVPIGGLETCPLAQRSNAPESAPNMVEPSAAQPVGQYLVEPREAGDERAPTITQDALVFGTSAIADSGMDAVMSAAGKCPTSYEVRGGPSPILGTYSVSSRPYAQAGWKGFAQQIAHTSPADDVYYEDVAHVVVHRANVILSFDFDQHRVIGQRSNATAMAERVLKTVLARLG